MRLVISFGLNKWAEPKLTPAEIEARMKVHENVVPEGVSGLRVSGV